MTRKPFEFTILRYVHDPVSAEFVNIGIILYSPGERSLYWRFTTSSNRLSRSFAGFQASLVTRFIECLENELREIMERFDADDLSRDHFFPYQRSVQSLDEVVRLLIPDQGGCFQTGGLLGGITIDFERELGRLFERYVSRYDTHSSSSRIDDAQLWHSWNKKIAPAIKSRFKKVKIVSPLIGERLFDHSYLNGKRNLIEPVSFDYKHEHKIQERADRVAGQGLFLHGAVDVGTFYVLVGAPQEKNLRYAYDNARKLIDQMPGSHQIVEEDGFDDFAKYVEDAIRAHELQE